MRGGISRQRVCVSPVNFEYLVPTLLVISFIDLNSYLCSAEDRERRKGGHLLLEGIQWLINWIVHI